MSTTSYLRKLSTWIEWKENHNYALVLKNVEFWKEYNKTMKLTHHFVQWKNFVTKLKVFFWNMKTKHVYFYRKQKIFYEISTFIHQMQKGISTIIKQMLQNLERMCKKKTSLLKIHLVIPTFALPSIVHKIALKN
jgi:hypothetical protein